jgi:hypothetical protein
MWYPRVAARVPDDATLDEFLPDADERRDETGERSGGDGGGGDEDRGHGVDAEASDGVDAEAAGPEPAVSTHRFHPDGRACADCGGTATRLWRDGDGLVCADCKQWRG